MQFLIHLIRNGWADALGSVHRVGQNAECALVAAFAAKHRRRPGAGLIDIGQGRKWSSVENCRAARPEVEMVLGSRVQLLGRDIVRRPLRHYLGRVMATLISLALNLPVYDTQCGAKLFRRTAELPALFERPFLTRWLFDVEIIARYLLAVEGSARAGGRRLYELPLDHWRDVADSKVRPYHFFGALYDLCRIRRAYRRPVTPPSARPVQQTQSARAE